MENSYEAFIPLGRFPRGGGIGGHGQWLDFAHGISIDGRTAEQGDWLSGFNDPTMMALVDEALENNYSLAAQLATVRAATADARAQRGSLLPTVTGAVSTGYRRSVFEGMDGDAVSSENPSYGLGLNASWEPDLWGRLALLETDLSHMIRREWIEEYARRELGMGPPRADQFVYAHELDDRLGAVEGLTGEVAQ